MENDQFKLPENAHRELKPGEEYEPILSKNKKYQEVTVWSVCIGLLMTILFSAAAAYLGLKVGQVFEAAIPIAIIAIGLTGLTRKNDALSQNVIIQSIGGCSGGVVAGAIFTLLLSANQNLGCRCGFGEGELAVLFFHEIFAEGDEEQDAQDAAEQRGDEHLPEVNFDLVAFALQDVEGRQSEDGTGHHAT